MATLHCNRRGCFDVDGVNVCYEPFRVVTATPLRRGPGTGGRVQDKDCVHRISIPVDAVFARMSTRNPGCAESVPLRHPTNGYVWGYGIGAFSGQDGFGWVPLSVLDTEADPEPVCGPAHKDFDRRWPYDFGRCPEMKPCGQGRSGVGTTVGGNVPVRQQVYLRYAPSSTPYHWLEDGDRVTLLCRVGGYLCVEVTRSRTATIGARGWINACKVNDPVDCEHCGGGSGRG